MHWAPKIDILGVGVIVVGVLLKLLVRAGHIMPSKEREEDTELNRELTRILDRVQTKVKERRPAPTEHEAGMNQENGTG